MPSVARRPGRTRRAAQQGLLCKGLAQQLGCVELAGFLSAGLTPPSFASRNCRCANRYREHLVARSRDCAMHAYVRAAPLQSIDARLVDMRWTRGQLVENSPSIQGTSAPFRDGLGTSDSSSRNKRCEKSGADRAVTAAASWCGEGLTENRRGS